MIVLKLLLENNTMSKEKLLKLVSSYLSAYSRQDSEGCSQAFTPYGALFSPYGPQARGRKAIAATHLEWFVEKEEDKCIEVLEFHQIGDSAHCLLGWSARVPNENEETGFNVARGVSLCVLTEEGDEVLFHRLALVPDIF
ncbi:MAG: ketosteroid isomerase-like protein [Granulosicoccus sp.]|jgi:ketosteroid isomerase-like protein